MNKFIKYLGREHLDSLNIGIYSTETGVLAVAENIVTGEELASLAFASKDTVEEWFDEVPGKKNGKLANAIDLIVSESNKPAIKDNRGGARAGAGRKAEDGATGLVAKTIKLTAEQKAWADEVGPARLRQVIEAARLADS